MILACCDFSTALTALFIYCWLVTTTYVFSPPHLIEFYSMYLVLHKIKLPKYKVSSNPHPIISGGGRQTCRKRGSQEGTCPPLFGGSVNPISTGGGHIPPHYYMPPPPIFRSCDGPGREGTDFFSLYPSSLNSKPIDRSMHQPIDFYP